MKTTKFYTNIVPYGNVVFVREIDETGRRKKHKVRYTPRFWFPTKTETKYKSIFNVPLKEVRSKSILEWRDYQKKAEEEDLPIFGLIEPQYQFIQENYPEEIVPDNNKIKIAFFDIETGRAEDGSLAEPSLGNAPIYSIAIKYNNFDKYIIFGTKPYENRSTEDCVYIQCNSEIHLLKKFLELWKKNVPDIVTGWYSNLFDIPFLINRIKLLLGDAYLELSPWGVVREGELLDQNFKRKMIYKIYGVSQLDYLDLYKKFTYKPLERYSLDYVAEFELGKNKVDYSHIGSLFELYDKDYQLFVDYNKKDVALIVELEEKLKLIDLVITLAYDSKVNYEDCFYQVRMWDSIIYNHLLSKNIVVPKKKGLFTKKEFVGAYVKNPQIGVKKWIVSFDVTSLYPHLIINYNISPETKLNMKLNVSIDNLLQKNENLKEVYDLKACVAGNGQVFMTEVKGFLPELMEKFFKQRKEYKKKMNEALRKYEKSGDKKYEKEATRYGVLQLVKKICLNSAYGAMGNEYFRFFDTDIAEAVTLSGQLTIRWIENSLNKFLNKEFGTENQDYCLASDTDSVYLNFEPFVNKLNLTDEKQICEAINEFVKTKMEPLFKRALSDLSSYMGCKENRIELKQEIIANKGFFLAKKRYCLNVLNNENIQYEIPKLKMMGVEAIKSSTPTVCRSALRETIRILLQESEESLHKYVGEFRKTFESSPIEDISFPRTANNIVKYKDSGNLYKKATPIHVRGCLLYNNYVLNNNLKTPIINDGDKIKFIYLKCPNPLKKENVIAYPGKLPKEMNIFYEYIDYDTQFQKSFIDPLQAMLDVIGFSLVKRKTLFDN